MSHPFTIIHGGQIEEKKPPKKKAAPVKFAQFDQALAIRERIRNRHIADRDKAIEKLRAQGKL